MRRNRSSRWSRACGTIIRPVIANCGANSLKRSLVGAPNTGVVTNGTTSSVSSASPTPIVIPRSVAHSRCSRVMSDRCTSGVPIVSLAIMSENSLTTTATASRPKSSGEISRASTTAAPKLTIWTIPADSPNHRTPRNVASRTCSFDSAAVAPSGASWLDEPSAGSAAAVTDRRRRGSGGDVMCEAIREARSPARESAQPVIRARPCECAQRGRPGRPRRACDLLDHARQVAGDRVPAVALGQHGGSIPGPP